MPDDPAPTNRSTAPLSEPDPMSATSAPISGRGSQSGTPYGSVVGMFWGWLIVVAVTVGWIAFMHYEAAGSADAPVSRVGVQDELTGRVIISTVKLEQDTGLQLGSRAILLQSEPLRTGSPAQRIAYAILIGAVDGPERGREALRASESAEPAVPWSESDLAMRAEVDRRFETRIAGGIVPSLEPANADRLGFFSELLDGSALWTSHAIITLFAAVGWYAVFGITGLVLLIVLIAMSGIGKLRAGCAPPSPTGLVLIETFAVWMCIFCGTQGVMVLVSGAIGDSSLRLLVAPLVFFGSLVALFWPRIRGVPWSVTRQAIGWRSNGLLGDLGWGAIGYSIALPLLGLGLLVAMVLSRIVGVPPNASHPAIERIGHAGPAGLANLFFLACITAPIVEETMFRGVLYRHIRDVTGPAGDGTARRGLMTALSVVVASVLSSAIFASIHPQGLVFAPVLAGLACGFCLVREWRGSILPGIYAHAATNFVTLALNVGLQSWLGLG